MPLTPFAQGDNQAAYAAISREPNTIILEFSGAKSDDIYDLRRGEGKIFRRIAKVLEQLKESGEVGENVQPIIVVVKEKREKRGLLDY
ncbi:MAG: hypothetical protein F6K35_21170 [Okeania sp. SIO2H7]|nr:hypothetical protein [Okeania sp. SIO2H7]